MPLFPVEWQRGSIIWFGCIDFLGVAGQVLDGEKKIRTEISYSSFFPQWCSAPEQDGTHRTHSVSSVFPPKTTVPGLEVCKVQTTSCDEGEVGSTYSCLLLL